jgi:putative ABC transport system permease protein
MLRNYLTIAWRQLGKNKLYAVINIAGLTVGLAIYLFSWLLVDYEESHDQFFAKAQRIFTVGSVFSPTASIGVAETDGAYTAFGPLFDAEIEGVEAVVRTVRREFLLSIDDDEYYETIRFTDPAFLDVFDFQYLEGDDTALDDPNSVLLTREAAFKFFGDEPALGRVITLDHDYSLRVAAVIEDLPRNTHLRGSLIAHEPFGVVAPLEALSNATGWVLEGNFNNLSMGNMTYLLVPEGTSRDWLQAQVDGVFERHFPDTDRKVIAHLKVRPLIEANTILWDMIGLPILQSVRVLGLLVLLVAIVNYTNLATAQSLGRAREIGLRKTMGADRRQLIIQFLVESLCISGLAMIVALAVLEIVVPVFNTATDKGLSIAYIGILPWLVTTTALVGLVAGAYPAYLITQVSPIDALRDGAARGVKGGRFRSIMLGLQFSITVFMLAMVLVMYLQNHKIVNSAEIYPRSEIIGLYRLNPESIQARLGTLKNELEKVPGVTAVSYVSQLPYQQSNSSSNVSRQAGDEESDFLMNHMTVDEDFLSAFDVPLLAGRFLDPAIAADTMKEGVAAANVVVNQLALKRLGFASPEEALGQVFYELRDEEDDGVWTIVGVLPDQNYQGFHNEIKPVALRMLPREFQYGAIRVEDAAMGRVLSDVEAVWKNVIPDYPIQSRFLDEEFDETFRVFMGLFAVLAGFAMLALMLSLIGLFGLAAFMAAGRTREIGVRKVMGAKVFQIVRLLIWQLSRPVLWALLIGLPLAYFASTTYLNFFADRIPLVIPVVLGAGVLSVLLAWAIVAVHAVRVARANPIHALRYE